MEAAAAAKPIVTSAVSGADDAVIEGNTGYILKINDLHGFVSHTVSLLKDTTLALQMGKAGQQHIKYIMGEYDTPSPQIRIWQKLTSHYRGIDIT